MEEELARRVHNEVLFIYTFSLVSVVSTKTIRKLWTNYGGKIWKQT